MTISPKTLATIPVGSTATIDTIEFDEQFCKRCFAMGLRCGAEVRIIRQAPFNGPIHIRIGTTDMCLRRSLAKLIKVL